MTEFWETNLILRTLAGSRAQGLAREGSDTDTRGVCIPPKEVLLGLTEFEQHESAGCDHVTYSLEKFITLALKANPNILETLYTEEEDILFINDDGRRLREARDLFLSKRVGQTFLGYAEGQLKRLRRHREWLQDPPTHQPEPQEFGAQVDGGRARFPNTDRKKAFDSALKHWNHFQTWRAERNAARAELEAKHGYDTKHAMHLMRLLQMGVEVLSGEGILVRRPDAEFLAGVRDGELEYDELMQRVDELTASIHELTRESSLPDLPNREAAESLLIELQLNVIRSS